MTTDAEKGIVFFCPGGALVEKQAGDQEGERAEGRRDGYSQASDEETPFSDISEVFSETANPDNTPAYKQGYMDGWNTRLAELRELSNRRI